MNTRPYFAMRSFNLCSRTSTPACSRPVVLSRASLRICARCATEKIVEIAGSKRFLTYGGKKRTSPPSGNHSASSNLVSMISWYAVAVAASLFDLASSCAVLCSKSVIVSRKSCCALYVRTFSLLKALSVPEKGQSRVLLYWAMYGQTVISSR